MKIIIFFVSIIILASSAVIPDNLPINYQGRVTQINGAPVIDSVYAFTFYIYPDINSITPLWIESANIHIYNGFFSHLLGSVSTFPENLFENNDNLYLEVKIGAEIIGSRLMFTDVPYAKSASALSIVDSSNSPSIKTSANDHTLTIYGYDPDTLNIILHAGIGGDSAVILPPSSINAKEILDEAGYNSSYSSQLKTLPYGYMIDLVKVKIRVPASGYVVLEGKCYAITSGTTGPNRARIQIDYDEGGTGVYPYYTMMGLGGHVNTEENYFPVYVVRSYYVSEGTYEFRLEGEALNSPPATVETWDHMLVVKYFPTSYHPSVLKDGSNIDIPEGTPIPIDQIERRYLEEKLKSDDK